MSCKHNGTETYYVPRGYSYRKIQVRCGNTSPYGDRAVCEKCAADPAEIRRIERHEENIAADNAALRSAGWGEM
mgnify:CR=1 FL=1